MRLSESLFVFIIANLRFLSSLQLVNHSDESVNLFVLGCPAGADAHAVIAVRQVSNMAESKFLAQLFKLCRSHNHKLLVGGGFGNELETFG